MMNFIMVPAIMAIITVGIYKLFELFVCKKERLMLIEKMGDKYEPDVASIPRFHSNYSFSALKIGCLLLGMGLGLLIGFIICTLSTPRVITNLYREPADPERPSRSGCCSAILPAPPGASSPCQLLCPGGRDG